MNVSKLGRRNSIKQVKRFKPEKDDNGDILRRKLLGTENQYERTRKMVKDRDKEHEKRMKALMRAQTDQNSLIIQPKKKKAVSNSGGYSSRGSNSSKYTIVTRKTFGT